MIKTAKNETTSSIISWNETGVPMIWIILCDDDAIFLERMRRDIRATLKKLDVEAVIQIFTEAEMIPQKTMQECDIIFLDIDFNDKKYTGIDVARKIREARKSAIIIFLTNYIEYAPEGYEVQAFRYALKSEIDKKLPQYLRAATNRLFAEKEPFQINVSGEPITLYLEDILYIESQGHNAVIFTQNPGKKSGTQKEYKVYSTLARFEQQLSERGFLRIQKSYLVNMRRLKQYRCSEAVLDNGITLPVSEKTYSENKKKFLLWRG